MGCYNGFCVQGAEPFSLGLGQSKRRLATLITPPKRFAVERSHAIAPPPLTDQAMRSFP
jgi:hypothetical protein